MSAQEMILDMWMGMVEVIKKFPHEGQIDGGEMLEVSLASFSSRRWNSLSGKRHLNLVMDFMEDVFFFFKSYIFILPDEGTSRSMFQSRTAKHMLEMELGGCVAGPEFPRWLHSGQDWSRRASQVLSHFPSGHLAM